MKKNLLILSCATFAMSAFAVAPEVGFMDQDAVFATLGEPHDDGKGNLTAYTMPAGLVLAETENVKMTMMYEQPNGNKQNQAFNGFEYVIVNGEIIKILPGIGGSENGKISSIESGPQAGGCIYKFDVKKSGYIVVVSKISSNKNFYAYEGVIGNAPTPLAYTLAMDIENSAYPDVTEVVYTLPTFAQDDEAAGHYVGQLDLSSPDIDKYTFGTGTIDWPIRIGTQNAGAAAAGNGTGVMVFPVTAEVGEYMCFATGSKMNTCGFVFVEGSEVPEVSVYREAHSSDDGAKEYTEKTIVATGGSESGIADIIVNETIDENAPMFNVLGQQVDASYKGLVIKNGKKFMNR